MRRIAILFALFFAVPLFADELFTITPDRGPVTGGTTVTITGSFGDWSYAVIFGDAPVPATRVNATTLQATTPAHLAGAVPITIFEYDRGLSTDLTFTFEGKSEDAFDAVLLPVFVPPVRGAFGSEFHTDLRARLVKETKATVWGLGRDCGAPCSNVEEVYSFATSRPETGPDDVLETGTPGAFFYLPKEERGRVAMNLRAYDTSRSAENFGTEIPIVRTSEFAKNGDPITLIGVPSDPRFRNTLRIYSYGETSTPLEVTIEGENGLFLEHVVDLPAQPDHYHPGYVEMTNFPTGAGMLRVTITPIIPPISAPIPPPDHWAFISVTNNETQHITLVTPQP